jgi:2-iminobutanoate/2-iminopropanoate deaminase
LKHKGYPRRLTCGIGFFNKLRQTAPTMKKTLMLAICLLPAACFAQALLQRPVTFKNPATIAPPKGYSQAVEVDMGASKMIVMAGQVALDKEGNLVGKGDVAKQTEQVFINIKHIVEDAGGSMDDIVKLNYFIKDVSGIQSLRDVRDRYINTKQPPASTLVEVSNLFRNDILIEIEATAIIAKKQ